MRNNPTMMITDDVSSYSELHNFVIFFSKIQEVYHMVKKVSSKTQYQFLAIYIKKLTYQAVLIQTFNVIVKSEYKV